MNQSKKITDGALLTTVFIALLLMAIFIPLLFLPVLFLLPIPFIFYTYKYDWKPSLIMLVASILLSSLVATAITFPLTLLVGVSGIMIGTAMHHNLSAYETWARGTLGFVVGLLFVYLFSQLVLQINWAAEIDQVVDDSMQMTKDLMGQIGIGEQSETNLALVEEEIRQLKDLLPVGIAILSAFLAFVTQWISFKVINRLSGKRFRFPPLRTLRLPIAIVWIYFVALVFTFFELNPDGMLYLVVQNVHVLAGLFIALQGFSFIFFYADHKKWSRALPIISVILTLLFPFLLLYLVRIIGIIDIGFAVRDRISNGKK